MWWTVLFAALSGFTAVAMGAAAAHALKASLTAEAVAWVETAVRYQAWHALACLGAGALMGAHPAPPLTVAVVAWIAGTVLFSGSLYVLAFTGVRGFAHVTPVGGLAFLVGWAALAWYAVTVLRN